MKSIIIVCMASMLLSPISVLSYATTERDYDSFVSGALEVYSQFKTPSKDESEKFYSFIQSTWNKTNCRSDCSEIGEIVAKQYVKDKKIEMIPPKKDTLNRKSMQK